MNPFAHITGSFDNHVASKYMGAPDPQQQSQLPSQLARMGGTPVSAAQQIMQPHQTQSAVPQPGRTPPEMTRNLPGMQTTPAMGILGNHQPQPMHMGPNMLNPNQYLNGQFSQSGASNPFLTYLSQKFGPNALFSQNQAAQLPIQGQQGTDLLQGVGVKNSLAMPAQLPIAAGTQIGAGNAMINLGPNSQGGIGI